MTKNFTLKFMARLLLAGIVIFLSIGSVGAVTPTLIPTAAPVLLPTIPTSAANSMNAAEWNFQAMLPIDLEAFTSMLGSNGVIIIIGIIILVFLAILWLETESVFSVCVAYSLLAGVMSLGGVIPADWGNFIEISCIVLPVFSVVYTIWKSHR